MSRGLLVGSAVAVFLLAGCDRWDSAGTSANDPEVMSARQAAARICRFVPDATTIIGILAKGVPGLGTGAEIAAKICEIVAPPGGERDISGTATLAGVTIKGEFVS